MKIDQAIGRRGFAITRLKLIISCAEVPRQSLASVRSISQTAPARPQNAPADLLNKRDREKHCGIKEKTRCAEPAARQMSDEIHAGRAQIGDGHLQQARNFYQSTFQTRNSRGLI
jgi:hypothetical protein